MEYGPTRCVSAAGDAEVLKDENEDEDVEYDQPFCALRGQIVLQHLLGCKELYIRALCGFKGISYIDINAVNKGTLGYRKDTHVFKQFAHRVNVPKD